MNNANDQKKLLRILIIDDEPLLIRAAARALRNVAIIVGANDGDTALKMLREGAFDAVVAEVSVLNKQGRPLVFELESFLQSWLPRLIIASGGKDIKIAQYFQKRYGCPLLFKPIDSNELIKIIEELRARPLYDLD